MSVETAYGPSQPDLVQSNKPPLNSGDHLSRAEVVFILFFFDSLHSLPIVPLQLNDTVYSVNCVSTKSPERLV
jgi:hypothetical protein